MARGRLVLSRVSLHRGSLVWLPLFFLACFFSVRSIWIFVVSLLLVAFTFFETSSALAYGIGTDSVGFSLTGCGPQGKDFVPVHQLITLRAADVWTGIPDEIRNHLPPFDQMDNNRAAGYDPGGGIITGSKEEDEEYNPLPVEFWLGGCSSTHQEICDGFGLNGFVEHFWNPDEPGAGGYNCGSISGGYNRGLQDVFGIKPAEVGLTAAIVLLNFIGIIELSHYI